MKIGRIEFGLSRDANGKVAPFEFHYNRGCCECVILTIGWFYLTWLSEECRYVDSDNVLGLLDVPEETLKEWTWEPIACPSCGDNNTEVHKDCHDKDNVLFDWNLCRSCGEDWMTADQVKAWNERKIK